MSTNKNVDILLVDDREDGLIALEALLGEYKNYRLVKAHSGREAIRLMDQYDFGVILLDVQMPELDGFQTAEIIRLKTRHQSIPILFVTAINKDERYIYRGYEAGAVDYIFKPFDPMVLKSKVHVFADLHVKNRMLREQARQLADLENFRRYQNLADSIPHMILRATPEGSLDYHNQIWTAYTGMTSSESLGEGWQKAIYAEDLGYTLRAWALSMDQGTSYEVECRIRRFDGAYRWHWVKAIPELNAKGDLIAWLGTCTDIHDRRAMEDRVREAQRAAEAASDAKTHFLANMSHEIRTPLNAIMGFTELLLEPNASDDEKMRSVGIVRRNCHQLMKIVDEILDISKVEAGELTLELVETAVMELLAEVHSSMSVQAEKKGIELKFETTSRLPSLVLTDSTRLRQILLNIVGNAIKFTSSGSVSLNARYATDMDGNSLLQFTVTDTGVGIDSASVQKIFHPFSQADSSTTRLFGGTGLGLALARKLARAMGGDVRLLKSEPGVGSTFVVVIAVELVSDAKWVNSVADSPSEAAEQPLDMPEGEVLRGRRILLVEDAEDNQFLIKQFLSKTGALVEVANNGAEGFEMAMAGDYEVILMDIQMPFVDGYQATTQLREAGYAKPIIALTAHALQEEREKSLKTGCNGHITKPINRRQLITSLVDAVV